MASDESRWALIQPRAISIDGDRVAYRVAGKGPVLLLVHGMAGSSVTWRHVMPALAKRFTVLAPDLLGQGQSDKPRGEYSLGTHANTLRTRRVNAVAPSSGSASFPLGDDLPLADASAGSARHPPGSAPRLPRARRSAGG
jgi:hypothetical protein